MSRKRRREFAPVKAAQEAEEAARLEKLAARPTRLLRKETRTLRLARTLEEAERAAMRRLLSGRAHRLERRGRRRMQRDEALRQTAMAASVSTLALLPAGEAAASSMSTLHDVPAAFQTMRDARDRIRSFHAAQKAVADAREALVQAEAALQSARQDARNAEQALVQAQENLATARRNLERLVGELAAARAESEQLTQAALASQQAVADYLPQIQAQEASIQSLTQDQAQVQADFQQQFGGDRAEGGPEAEPKDVLAESIRKAWESVDWQQNRLAEVQQQVTELLQSGAAAAGTVQQPGSEGQREAFVQRLEEIDAELDAEEAALDDMYSFLDELEAARDAAEDAESDARARVEDLSQEQMDTETDIRQQETDLEDTKKWREEAEQNLIEAEKYKREATGELAQAEHELEHFGEGSSWQSRLEYYNWHGPFSGHQFVIGQSYYANLGKWDFGLDTGYVTSSSGREHGHVSGWTDTTLAAIYKNDHKLYDVHYLLSVNVPTGRTAHVNAQLPEGLARHTSFGEGWNVTPGVEVTRHLTEENSLTARLSYVIRGNYDYKYSSEVFDAGGRRTGERQEEGSISPGNQLLPELEYLHAGEHGQFLTRLGYTYTGTTRQNAPSGSGSYKEGSGWHLRLFYSHDVTPVDSWQAFASWSRTGATSYGVENWDSPYNRPVNWLEGGLGWTHHLDARQQLHLMFTYQRASGYVYLYDRLRGLAGSDLNNYWQDPERLALQLAYECKLDDTSQLELRVEHYNIRAKSDNGYRGWGAALMYTKNF